MKRLCVLFVVIVSLVLASIAEAQTKKSNWVSSNSDASESKYGWKTEYRLETPTRVFMIMIGTYEAKKKVAINVTNIPEQIFFHLYAEDSVAHSSERSSGGMSCSDTPSSLLSELKDNLDGLPVDVAKQIRDVRVSYKYPLFAGCHFHITT